MNKSHRSNYEYYHYIAATKCKRTVSKKAIKLRRTYNEQ